MSGDAARALWLTGAGRCEIRSEALPPVGADDVRVQALYSGISRGTEALVFAGRVPVSEHERMRAPHQQGAFPFPIKYGYANVGLVTAGPSELRGRTVFCLYPHQSEYVVAHRSVVPLPDGVPPSRAVLAANMETALNAVWDADPTPGTRIAVLGAGVVGCLVAYLLSQTPGAEVILFDIDPRKQRVAAALGIPWKDPDDGQWNLVVHASGDPAGLRRALDLAAPEGTILELSWYGDRPVELPLGAGFHSKRLTLRSSQVGRVSPRKRGTVTHEQRLALALSLLADPRLDGLLDGETPFSDLPARYAAILAGPAGTLCHRVHYGS